MQEEINKKNRFNKVIRETSDEKVLRRKYEKRSIGKGA